MTDSLDIPGNRSTPPYYVVSRSGIDYASYKTRLESYGAIVEDSLHVLDEHFFLWADSSAIDKVKADSDTLFVGRTGQTFLQSSILETASAPYSINDISFKPQTFGADVNVLVMDSGINFHKCFGNRLRYLYSLDANNSDSTGHGTHVASLIAGEGYGVAVGADVYSVKVISNSPLSGSIYIFLQAVDAIIKWQAHQTKPCIINISLSGSLSSQEAYYAVNVFDNLLDAKCQVVVAAGNYGLNLDRTTSFIFPAEIPDVITVGALDGQALARWTINNQKVGTNYGDVIDFYAPGVGVVGASWIDSTASRQLTGTSQAAPLVSGYLACLTEGQQITYLRDMTRIREQLRKQCKVITDPLYLFGPIYSLI